MTELIIDGEKYVLLTKDSYDELQKKAALKAKPEIKFTLQNARTHSKQLIHKWAAEK